MSLVVEQRFHDFRIDLHAPPPRLGNDRLKDVNLSEFFVLGPKVLDEGVRIVLGVLSDVRAPLERPRILSTVIRPAIDLPRDPTADLQPKPRNCPDEEHIDAEPLLQHVQQWPDSFVNKADRADLNPDELVCARLHDLLLRVPPSHTRAASSGPTRHAIAHASPGAGHCS